MNALCFFIVRKENLTSSSWISMIQWRPAPGQLVISANRHNIVALFINIDIIAIFGFFQRKCLYIYNIYIHTCIYICCWACVALCSLICICRIRLYYQEFYEMVKTKLTPNGIFVTQATALSTVARFLHHVCTAVDNLYTYMDCRVVRVTSTLIALRSSTTRWRQYSTLSSPTPPTS